MFGRGGSGFDPFQQMNSMMRRQMVDMEDLQSMMMDPFGMMGGGFGARRRLNPRQEMIENGPRENPQRYRGGAVAVHRDPFGMHDDAMMPFGGGFGGLLGGGLFGGINGMMQQMEQHAMNDPNSHVYTQSTVIGMAPGADGRLNYYESTDSVRKAGNVKEVRKSVRDTSKGVEKMSIGHHIGDRAHIIEKRRDKKGNIVENQEFVGLKEDEAKTFDREFASASKQPGLSRNRLQHEDRQPSRHMPIEDVTSRTDRRDRNSSPYARASDRRKPRGPIIEEIE